MSDLAGVEIDARQHRVLHFLTHVMRRIAGRSATPGQSPRSGNRFSVEYAALADGAAPDRPADGFEPGEDPEESAAFRWRRHPQLRQQMMMDPDLDSRVLARGARSAAVRGLFLARSGRFEDARASFAAAAESSVDLTAIPGFWDLPRSGMLAAVDAYADVERFRDASALGALIRLTYRPRSISTVRGAPDSRNAASGS